MMTRFSKWLPALALAGFALLGSPPSARAVLSLEAQGTDINGTAFRLLFVDEVGGRPSPFLANGAINPAATAVAMDLDGDGFAELIGNDANLGVVGSLVLAGAVAGNPVQIGNFLVTGSSHLSNSPGTSGIATLTSTSLNVINNTGVSSEQRVAVSDTGFGVPTAGTAISQVFGTILGGTGSVAVFSRDDDANRLFGGLVGFPGQPFGPLAPAGTVVDGFTGQVFTGVYNQSVTNTFAFTAPYSKTVQFNITLAGGASLNQRSNVLTNIGGGVVPEPGTMVLALTGLPLLGIGAWRRRRRAQA
jgi:hypothetical protein